jgi:hypothetical protein
MAISVHPADIDSDAEQILATLDRNLTDLPHRARFDWMYRRNPAGRAWAWLAYDTDTRKTVGVASLCPHMVWVKSGIQRCGQVRDFAIDMSHRSLGPAVLLQRATFGPVDEGLLSFCYDCPPDDKGMSTFRRLKMGPSCQMQRYARILKLDRRITSALGDSVLAGAVGDLGNRLIRIWNRSLSGAKPEYPGIEISSHEGCFGEEFTELDRRIGAADTIRCQRAAKDLNWRYHDNPIQRFRILTARRRRELLAYLVYLISGQDAYVIDLFGHLPGSTGRQLLEATVGELMSQPVQTLHWLLSGGDDLSSLASGAGFSYRSAAARVVAYLPARAKEPTVMGVPPRWRFTHADVIA